MRIDLTSLAFGYEVLKGGGNPNWATSLGQGHDYKIIESEEYLSILPGMIYTSVSLSTIKVKLGKGGKQIDGSSPDSPVVMASVFNKVYINGSLIKKGRFVLLITRDDSQSHFGRLRLKYSPSTTYQLGAKQFTNSEFFELAKSSLGLGNDACWFVYDISIQRQDELHFAAVVVNKNKSVKYEDAQALRVKWNKLIPEGTALVQYEAADHPFQLITYGAPGTGKSDGIERKMRENQIEPIRTTFHPDSDYQSFVGAYKPFMKKIQRVVYVNDGKTAQLVTGPDELKDEEVISYEFRPQSFTEAYVKAWEAMVAGETKPVVLVIEEINRGDCAKIFGDLFQLLDRDDKTGFSRYPIVADKDLGQYLKKKFSDIAAARSASAHYQEVYLGKKLILPPNLYIWATMNTSDQSLFPMDSAFKRRWEWKYVPIKNHKDEGWTIDVSGSKKYDWWDFLQKVNKHIFDLTNSEDKQLGYFFVKAKDKVVTLDVFVNKVVFYLWNAVFKDCYTECDFLKDGSDYLIFTKFFDDEGNAKADVVQKFLDALKVDPPKASENGEKPVEAD